MEPVVKIISNYNLLTFFTKRLILGFWKGSEYASIQGSEWVSINYKTKKQYDKVKTKRRSINQTKSNGNSLEVTLKMESNDSTANVTLPG